MFLSGIRSTWQIQDSASLPRCGLQAGQTGYRCQVLLCLSIVVCLSIGSEVSLPAAPHLDTTTERRGSTLDGSFRQCMLDMDLCRFRHSDCDKMFPTT